MSRILLIQADEVRRLHNASVLRTAGHEVHEAAQGRASVSMARRLRPDVVVCDIQLPEFNGLDVVTALRRGMMAARTPLLMLLPRADPALVKQAMAAGADDCLAMPMAVHALRDAVAQLLTPGDAAAGAPVLPPAPPQAEPVAAAGTSDDEERMADEINRQWVASERADALDELGHATFLVADLFGHHNLPDLRANIDARHVLPRVSRAVDSLKLFGAAHVLPFGMDLMAIFPSHGRNRGSRDRLRAVRAAFGLLSAIDTLAASALPSQAARDAQAAMEDAFSDLPTVPGVLPDSQPSPSAPQSPDGYAVSIALHCGELYLARLHDGLHQTPAQLMPLGKPLAEAVRMREQAARKGWRFAASEQALRGIDRAVTLGRTNTAVSDHGVSSSYEVLAMR